MGGGGLVVLLDVFVKETKLQNILVVVSEGGECAPLVEVGGSRQSGTHWSTMFSGVGRGNTFLSFLFFFWFCFVFIMFFFWSSHLTAELL